MATETWIVTEPTVIDLELVRSVKVGLIGGQVDIVAHDEPGARVEVHSVEGRDLKVALEGDTLVVDHPQLKWETFLDNFKLFIGKAKAEVSILVPRNAKLTLNVVTAEGLVSGLHCDATIHTVNGDVVLDSLVGDVSVHAVSAEVSVRAHQGSLDVQSVSGDVTVSGEVRRFTCDSVSADVVADLRGTPDRIINSSVSGDLTVRLDAGVPAQYSINTLTGRLQLDDSRITGVKGRYTGRYGQLAGSFTEVRASSVNGDVSVVHTDRGTSTAAESDTAEATS
ncbi:DUF4097 family beta strand repeat-containing protein [Nostoc sp. CHAB 5834]|nr:DUF4097 family beta strand repeat-containing protein [Nostoc sp. CHAB 5834]